MNERIRELTIKALANCDPAKMTPLSSSVGNGDWVDIPLEFSEQLARLIVLECEKVAKDPQWYSESPSNGWRNPIRHVCNVMKEQFGAEK